MATNVGKDEISKVNPVSLMRKEPLDVPVLLVIFNRPDLTQKVFDVIKKVRPAKLFVKADGPRSDRPSERALCEEARRIATGVDWNCEVKTSFSETNAGCRLTVSSGIDWFFENVDAGIILEDDCIPAESFFWFCRELLERYRDDTRIMQICGSNYLFGKKQHRESYYFSKLNEISGWATWRRAWKYFDLAMPDFKRFDEEGLISNYIQHPRIAAWLMSYMREAAASPGKTWSPAWVYAMCRNNALTIVPSVNMVFHLYGRPDAMSSSSDCWSIYNTVEVHEMSELVHPRLVVHDREADRIRFDVIRKVDPRLIPSERIKIWWRWKVIESVKCFMGRVAYVRRRLLGR